MFIEAARLGPAYATKRREMLGHFAALVRTTSTRRSPRARIPPVGTDVTAYAWLGARTEVLMQSLAGELPALADAVHALSALLRRSVGAADFGAASRP